MANLPLTPFHRDCRRTNFLNGALEVVAAPRWEQYNNLPTGQTPSLRVVNNALRTTPYTVKDGGGDIKRNLGAMYGSGATLYYGLDLNVAAIGSTPGSGLITGFRQPTSLGGTLFVRSPDANNAWDFRIGLSVDGFQEPSNSGSLVADNLDFNTSYYSVTV